MASAPLRCPFCGQSISRDLFSGGATARCPHCGHAVAIQLRTIAPSAASTIPAAAAEVTARETPSVGGPPVPVPNGSPFAPLFPLAEPPRQDGRPLIAAACVVGGGGLVALLLLGVLLWRAPEGRVADVTPAINTQPAAPASPAAGVEPAAPPSAPSPGTLLPGTPPPSSPAVPAAGPPADQGGLKPGEGDVCYRWKEGEEYCYRFSCKAQAGGRSLDTSGTNTYRVGRLQEAAPAASDPREARQGSGTAFVVSADGHLVTCAHVVRNATDIKVTLGDQTTPCQVVARDDARDLAILHTARQGLAAIPLADSEKVELAEEVRAIGYPLSDVLGSSLKVTQGSIAGIAVQRRGKVFQIDATVNPGNSGGPLVNGSGAVVGVVNAGLFGIEISKVGFAVPINYAKTLLERHRVAFQAAAAGSKLDGPTLAKRVGPSVGLVTMTCHGRDSDGRDRVALYYHAIVESNRHTASSQPAGPERDDGKLVVDEYGEVFECNGRVDLPCLLGPVASLVIDPFPTGGEKTWQRQQRLTIVSSRGRSMAPFAGFRPPGFHGPRFGPRPPFRFGPFAEPEPPLEYPAVQQTTYTMEDPQGTTVLIRKRLDLRTLERVGSDARIELTGSGETLFDLKAGAPRKVTFAGTFTVRGDGETTRVPVTLTCERVAGSTLTQSPSSPSPPSAPGAAVASAPSPPPESAESTKSRLDAILADLRATDRDWSKCFQALQNLAIMQPVQSRRDEVAEVLDKFLTEKNYSARSSALRAAQLWGTKRNVPALIGLLRPSESDSVRQRAMEILGRLGDERSAKAFAELIKNPADRDRASIALRTLGRGAESAVVALVAHDDPEVRAEACKILADIGGPTSAAALKEQLAKETDAGAKTAAKRALEKLDKK